MKTTVVGGIAVGVVIVVIAGVLLGTGTDQLQQQQPIQKTPQQQITQKQEPQQSQIPREEITPIKSAPEIKLPSKNTQTTQIESSSQEYAETYPYAQCSGSAGCYKGHITKVIDGDTIEIDGNSVRLVLVDTP